jgi:uncharacterized protein (DUF2141 family)
MAKKNSLEFLQNMAISSLVAHQGEDSDTISDFTVTLKQIRQANTQIVAFDKKKYQDRAKQQAQTTTNKSNTKGKSLGISLYDYIAGE